MARKNSFEPAANETVIAAGVEVKGNLTTEHNIWFDGNIAGNIASEGGITVGPQGQVLGNLKGSVVVIAGKVDGNVRSDQLIIQEGGQLRGDIYTGSLGVGSGATINGNVRMPEPKLKLPESQQQDTNDE